MDKNNIERPQKFDRNTYNKQYSKDHYVNFGSKITPELKTQIDDYCTDNNISKSEFLKLAIEALRK